MTMMDMPYVIASQIPWLFLLLRFRKKLTVIGMIGQMHGMRQARSPPTKPMRRIYNKEWLSEGWLPPRTCSSFTTGFHSVALSADGVCVSVAESAARVLCADVLKILSLLAVFLLVSFPLSSLKAGALPAFCISAWEGGMQFLSLQAPYSRYALIL